MCISVELNEAFDYAEKINVYNDGQTTVYRPQDRGFDEIIVGWKAMIDGARTMPAFGVSLDRETRQELKHDLWVEFDFDRRMEYRRMPYEKLLIKVERYNSGFNLIRYTAEKGYDGRCFYYDLVNNNMSDFYDILLNLQY